MANPINASEQDQVPVKKTAEEGAFEVSSGEKKSENVSQVVEQVEQKQEGAVKEAEAQQELRQKIENIDLADDVKQQASAHAGAIASLSMEEKMNVLLKAAKDKGVVYAVNMAKKMNDPYMLDMLHDTLAREGHYKDFLK